MCTASGVKYSSLIHSLCLSSAFFYNLFSPGMHLPWIYYPLNKPQSHFQYWETTQAKTAQSWHTELSQAIMPWQQLGFARVTCLPVVTWIPFHFLSDIFRIPQLLPRLQEMSGEGAWHRSNDAWEKNRWERERNDCLISSWHKSGAESEQIASLHIGSGPCAASMFYFWGRAGVPPSKLDPSVLPLVWIMSDFSWTCIILPTVLIFFSKKK